MKKLPIIFLFFFLSFVPFISLAQPTGLQGRVVDAQSGENMPFVQVGFVGTTIGTVTDGDGRFRLTSERAYDSVRFQMMGYAPKTVVVRKGFVKRGVKIELVPRANTLKTAEVTAKRSRKNRYRRRDNPAVELARNVIANKDRNRLKSGIKYSRNSYEKELVALDDFEHDFDNKWPWRRLKVMEKYIGRTPFDETPALYISIRETKRIEQHGDINRALITARHLTGMNEMMGQDGMDSTFSAMFAPIDIYDNDIEIMLTHFTGPLNSALAIAFYHYYITDTLEYNGIPCVELSFAPANTSTYGFTGHLLIALDGSYAVVAYNMAVANSVSLNYVRNLTIVGRYKGVGCNGVGCTDWPKYVPERSDIYGRIYASQSLQELYVQQTVWHDDYRLGDSAVVLPDSLFPPLTSTVSIPREKLRSTNWDTIRPIPLSKGERSIDSMRHDIMELPELRFLKKFAIAVFTGYVASREERDSSAFDLGPVYNFVNYNHHEGWRFRVGGMTTAILNSRNYIEGYAAYGFRDRRPKFSSSFIHTFDEKHHNSHESPLSLISLHLGYDLEAPGQSIEKLDRDNISSSNDFANNLQYVAESQIRLRKEYPSHFNIDTWLAARHFTPTGTLHYYRYLSDSSLEEVEHFAETEWTVRLAYFPYLVQDFSRPGNASLMRLKKDWPTIILSHRIAYMTDGFFYQRTDFTAEKRFNIGLLGYVDGHFKTGIIWNRVPLPRLIIPDGNDGIFLAPSAFNTMHPMEFIVDRYASLHTAYHMKGLILSHIPIIRRLKLREVVGFNILCGALSDKNNPEQAADNTGLYKFPIGTSPLGQTPYMECSIGIENILNLIRIDYVHRLTYINGLTPQQRGAIKLEIRIML